MTETPADLRAPNLRPRRRQSPSPRAVAARRGLSRSRVLARRARTGRRKRFIGLIVAALAVLCGLVGAGAMVGFAYLDSNYSTLPDTNTFQADSFVLDRAGHPIAELHPPGETRVPIRLDQSAPVLRQATISVEDRNFWNEGAIDTQRILSAAWQDLSRKGGDPQGASTIPQQLAKVLYLNVNGERTVDRKLHEIFIARRLDQQLSKQQILEDYLNDIYYGRGATGIEAAAHVYFGVPAARLDLAQAAMLAGLPNSPAMLDPIAHPVAATARQAVVLEAMVSTGSITRAQEVAARAENLVYANGSSDNLDSFPILSRRIANQVSSTLHVDPYRAGLHIVTTVDAGLEAAAQNAVTQQVSKLGVFNAHDGALVAVDPQTGDIVAYVGNAGPGFPASQIDMAAHPRQPGSTFKLFTYSTAIGTHRVTMDTPVLDAPLTLPTGAGRFGSEPYTVYNYDLKYHGTLPVKQALGNSLNVPAVKVELATGIPAIVRTARAMGVSTLTQPDDSFGASTTLGTHEVPLWEMAQAGSVLASGGQLRPAQLLVSVQDKPGHELLPHRPAAKQVIDPGTAFIMNTILRTDPNRYLEFGPRSDLTVDGHLVAAKTGTTQDFRDNLTVGWNPHLAIATWVGNPDNAPMAQGTTGITGAAPIWHQVMSAAIASRPDDWQPPPADVHQGQGGDWFLTGADQAGGTSDVQRNGICRSWVYNGSRYWWCGSTQSNLPGDPGPTASPTDQTGAPPNPGAPPVDLTSPNPFGGNQGNRGHKRPKPGG